MSSFPGYKKYLRKRCCFTDFLVEVSCDIIINGLYRAWNRPERIDKYPKTRYSINYPCSRGVSGALYLQSATVGVMPIRGAFIAEQPFISGVDAWVLRNRNL